MSQELIPLSELVQVPGADDATFSQVAKGADFLPRLVLTQSGTDIVKEGKASQGQYYVVRGKNDSVDDLNKETVIVPLGWRPKALDISNREAIVSCHDLKDPKFAEISQKSEEQDSGCMFGPEFLVWVPSIKVFALFYCNSKTLRREAPKIKALMGKAALLRVELIRGKRFSWFGSVVTIYSGAVEVPDIAVLRAEMEKFAKQPTGVVVGGEPAPTGIEDRR